MLETHLNDLAYIGQIAGEIVDVGSRLLDFLVLRCGDIGLKPGCIDVEIIFTRVLRAAGMMILRQQSG
jgi:hypothetical protein